VGQFGPSLGRRTGMLANSFGRNEIEEGAEAKCEFQLEQGNAKYQENSNDFRLKNFCQN
jgi:hypothetical protein